MMSKWCNATSLALVAGTLALLPLGGPSAADEVFKATKAIPPLDGRIKAFDISYVDSVLHLYVLGDRTNKAVDVVDTTSNTMTNQLTATPSFVGVATSCATGNNNDCSGPDGVLILRTKENGDGLNEVWAGDGDSTVKVIDLASGKTEHVISTNGKFRADEMCFDPRDNLVMAANNADDPPFATLISTTTYKVVGNPIKFDGTNGAPKSNNGAEQCQWSPVIGKFLISIPGIVGAPAGGGGVAVIDPKTGKVEKTYLISGDVCIAPQGMAIGPNNQVLLGCNGASGNGKGSTVIINVHSGSVIAVLDNESGSDEVWFNPDDGHYFLARSSALGAFQQLGVVDARGHREDQSVPTVPTGATSPGNAHSVAADFVHNQVQVYVPIPGNNTGQLGAVCSKIGGSDTTGCIAVYTTTHDDFSKQSRKGGEGEGDNEQR
jgi:hypothetical protein